MFEYNICNQTDETLFYRQCEALKANIPGLVADELLEDVDGSLIQRYQHSNGGIIVRNDMQTDALYVSAEFDLLPFFNQN